MRLPASGVHFCSCSHESLADKKEEPGSVLGAKGRRIGLSSSERKPALRSPLSTPELVYAVDPMLVLALRVGNSLRKGRSLLRQGARSAVGRHRLHCEATSNEACAARAPSRSPAFGSLAIEEQKLSTSGAHHSEQKFRLGGWPSALCAET